MRTATVLAVLALALPAALADEPPRPASRFQVGAPLNVQLAFDRDAMTHDLDFNTTIAAVTTAAVDTASFLREGVEHRFRVRLEGGELHGLELVRLGEDGAWRRVPPDVFQFVPAVPPRRASEVDDEGRAIVSLWGTCNLGPDSKERDRALLVVRSGHVDGAGVPGY